MWAPLAPKVTFCVVMQGPFPSWAPQGPTLKIRKNHMKFNMPKKHKNTPKVSPYASHRKVTLTQVRVQSRSPLKWRLEIDSNLMRILMPSHVFKM